MSILAARRGSLHRPTVDSGGGGGSDPSSISDLHAWYDADALTGLSDTDPVAQWDDESINGHHLTQDTGSAQPTYRTNRLNGLPGVAFDGGDGVFTPPSDAFSAVSGATVFVVAQHSSGSLGSAQSAFAGRTSGGLNTHSVAGSGSSGNWSLWAGSTLDSGVDVSASAHRITAVVDGASSSIDIDGTSQPGNAGTRSSTRWFIGLSGGFNQNWSGEVFEVIVYTRVLNSTEIADVESYLTTKWGL